MNTDAYRIGCILLAAGNAVRFHSNKLNALFHGRTLFERALDTIPEEAFYRVVVVSQYPALMQQAKARGFEAIFNEHPEAGLSHTIALGIGAAHDADALLFMVSDQPLLRKQSVKNALLLYKANPSNIVVLAYGQRRGNPCIFPRAFFPALFALEADQGGSTVIKANEDKLLLSYVQDGRELNDVDTLENLHDLIR